MRAIALDVHRDFCEVAIVEEGRLRSAGRIETRPETLELFAQSLDARDWVALEVTGNAWAIVTVEDLDGGIEVMMWPSVYQLASTYLVEDAIITVRGFLSREKDTPTIKAQEVTVPDLSDGPTGPVVISLPSTRCTPPVVEQLKEVLSTHPGMTEVQLKLLARTSTTVLRLDERLRVTATPALFADLKQLLGPGCLSG